MIRKARLQDLPALTPLFVAYLRFYRKRTTPAAARAYLRARLRRRESTILLARIDGRDVGFAQLYPSFCSLEQRPILILYDLFVAPGHRRQGIARALLDAAHREAARRRAARIELSTAANNASARRLYAAAGYHPDRTFIHYARRVTDS